MVDYVFNKPYAQLIEPIFLTGGFKFQIQQDSAVQLIFSHPGKNRYMIVNSAAEIFKDRKKIAELWSPIVKFGSKKVRMTQISPS